MANIETIKKNLSPWKGPTGNRYYVNNWMKLCGINIDWYKSGNPCSVSVRGTKISNGSFSRNIWCGKVWYDEEGKIHLDNLMDDRLPVIKTADIAKAVEDHFEDLARYDARHGGVI